MSKAYPAAAFSLVEVTLALGIAAFCLITVFGLMPIGVQTNRNATSQTAATSIVAAVIADLRATPKTDTYSSQFAITFGTNATRYFDSQAQCSCDSAGSQKPNSVAGDCSLSWSPALQPRYQLSITWSGTTTLRYADLKVTWPPTVVLTTPTPMPSGSAEMFAAFDRN
jgi:Tfp pilus assembly protein PilV